MYIEIAGIKDGASLMDILSDVRGAASTTNREVRAYPPTDIGIDAKKNLFIDIALAGFSKEDIKIKRVENRLHIIGVCSAAEELIEEYFEQNISQADFERIIVIEDKYTKGDIIAQMENGLLSITLFPTDDTVEEVQIL